MLETQIDRKPETKCKTSAIDSWLTERTQVIVLYCKLSGYRNQTKLPGDEQINLFCDILIDYVSAGHFEVYEQIVNNCDINGPESLELLNKLYPDISKTTDVVVEFNERYSKKFNNDADYMVKFDRDLSTLGEALAKRIDLEDNLIDTLKSKH